jgi:hypothetical protein
MKNLEQICLLTIDGVGDKVERLTEVIKQCRSRLLFKTHIHFGVNPINGIDATNIIVEKFDYFTYNKFCINYLYKFLEPYDFTHCLLVQEDGFIVNPELWDDSFLNYDYIGAPWLRYKTEPQFPWVQHFGEKAAVGNGGFCLRSKKFIKECSDLNYQPGDPNEDVFLCALANDYLVSKGIVFADINTAGRFSLETKNDLFNNLENVFGFHGKHLLDDAWKHVRNKHND